MRKRYYLIVGLLLAWGTTQAQDVEGFFADIKSRFSDPFKIGGGLNASANSNGLADLTKVISKNKHAPCCGKIFVEQAGDVHRHLESLDKYLDDVLTFTKGFSGVDGAVTMISLLKNGQRYQIDAMAQTLRQLRGANLANIIRFEPRLGNVLNAADDVKVNQIGDILIMFEGGVKLIELKAWYKNGLSRITSNAKFFDQFKAYLNNDRVTDISKLEYIFDARKLSSKLEMTLALLLWVIRDGG